MAILTFNTWKMQSNIPVFYETASIINIRFPFKRQYKKRMNKFAKNIDAFFCLVNGRDAVSAPVQYITIPSVQKTFIKISFNVSLHRPSFIPSAGEKLSTYIFRYVTGCRLYCLPLCTFSHERYLVLVLSPPLMRFISKLAITWYSFSF